MSARPSYMVTVIREGTLWTATVEGLPPGCVGVTDVEHFAHLDVEVRDLVAGLTDATPESFTLVWLYTGDREYTVELDELFAWEKRAKEAVERREEARRSAVEAMRAAGLSQRAIADVVGLSHQRVQQLLAEAS